jgi:hypothetical protein
VRIDPRFLSNVAVFQLGWFACVLGAARGLPLVGLATAAVAIGLHLWLAGGERSREGLLVAGAALLGGAWESLVAGLGFVVHPEGGGFVGFVPLWIVALWALFATTLTVSLRWLYGRPALAMVAGAVGGPMAWFSGARLGAVTFPDPVVALAVESAGWALLLPLLVRCAERLTKTEVPPRTLEVNDG